MGGSRRANRSLRCEHLAPAGDALPVYRPAMTALIRLATAADAAAIAVIYRPYVEDSRISFEEEAPEAAEVAQRMASPIHPWLVAEEEDRVLGYASTSPMRDRRAYRWSVETGIYLDPPPRASGLGRQLLNVHLDLLARQGFITVIAGIALPNEASVALHEKLGFTLSGIERGVRIQARRMGRCRPLAERPRVPDRHTGRAGSVQRPPSGRLVCDELVGFALFRIFDLRRRGRHRFEMGGVDLTPEGFASASCRYRRTPALRRRCASAR